MAKSKKRNKRIRILIYIHYNYIHVKYDTCVHCTSENLKEEIKDLDPSTHTIYMFVIHD